MGQHILRRLIYIVPTLVGVALLGFALLKLAGGDPVLLLAGEDPDPQMMETIRRQLGLDRPLHEQFLTYLYNTIRGDLGESYYTHQPVIDEIARRYPRTFTLAVVGVVFSTSVGLTLGLLAGVRPHSVTDRFTMLIALVGVSVPGFWLALMLIYVFSVELAWLPSIGLTSPQSLVLPVLVNSSFSLAYLARMTRAEMIDVLTNDYVRTARSKGLRERVVVIRHALKNALIPLITIAGLSFGFQLSGSVITETIFSIDGIGTMIVRGILARDAPLIQAGILVVALNFIVITFLLDLLYAYANPRIRF
jgi:ABC-type dipeptide/oligopeptide/nickel transport system permease component